MATANPDCAFCSDPECRARVFAIDEHTMAFPTHIPITPGHVLVCPVRHVGQLSELTDTEWLALRRMIEQVQVAAKDVVGAEGFNLAWSQGTMAGQSEPHLHVHVVPRTTGDQGIYQYDPRQFLYRPGSREQSPADELRSVARQYREALAEVTA